MKYSFNKEEGKWQRYTKIRKGKPDDGEPCFEWVDCPITNVPVSVLCDEWEKLIRELSRKEVALQHVKKEFAEKEFQIKYIEDIDFKGLYGKANDDTRNHHVKLVCKELLERKNGLELSVDYLKREINLLKSVVNSHERISSIAHLPEPKITFNGDIATNKKQLIKALAGLQEIKDVKK